MGFEVVQSAESLQAGWTGLGHKPVANRRIRPALVMDNKAFMLHCVGKRAFLRHTIGLMYWRENKSARDIATDLNMTLGAVEKIIQRLARSLRTVDSLNHDVTGTE